MVGEADKAECGLGARGISGQSAAQAAAPALPARHGGSWGTGRAHFHTNRRARAAFQILRRTGVRTVADAAGFANAILLPAHARILAGVHVGNDAGAVAGVVLRLQSA